MTLDRFHESVTQFLDLLHNRSRACRMAGGEEVL